MANHKLSDIHVINTHPSICQKELHLIFKTQLEQTRLISESMFTFLIN